MKIEDMINKVICSDCLEVMRDMPDNSVDLVLTDPDYNAQSIGPKQREYENSPGVKSPKEYLKFCNDWFLEAQRITIKENIVFTPGILNTHNYPQPYWQICWHKPAAVSFNRLGGYNAWEPIFTYNFPKTRIGQDYIKVNTLNFSKGPEKEHPCPKQPDLWGWLLRHFSNEGDLIFDPFSGSGTTAVKCKEYNREFIVTDIIKKYCKIAEQRLSNTTPCLL